MNENTKKNKTYKSDLLYPELSYKIVGLLFEIYESFGPGRREEYYQKALSIALSDAKLAFKKELPVKINYKGKFIATNYLDFLVEEKIVVEMKQGDRFNPKDIKQVYGYLQATKLKLGILARFTHSGVKYKRIVNVT